MQVGNYKPSVLLDATLDARPLAVCLVVASGEVSLVARARGALQARCGWRACCCGGCGLPGVRLGLCRLPAGPGAVFGAAGVGRALACRVCWASVAAGSGSVVKPRASWALVGGGGPLGLGRPAARPVGKGWLGGDMGD